MHPPLNLSTCRSLDYTTVEASVFIIAQCETSYCGQKCFWLQKIVDTLNIRPAACLKVGSFFSSAKEIILKVSVIASRELNYLVILIGIVPSKCTKQRCVVIQ